MRRKLFALFSLALGLGAVVVAVSSTSGHTALHLGCSHHDHGPTRTAAEGKRLLNARALARQGRVSDGP